MDYKQRFKALILALENKGVIRNQQDLADRMGYPKATMSSIVSGRLPLSAISRDKLKQVYAGINLDWLTNGTGEMFSSEQCPQSISQHNVLGTNAVHCVDSRIMAVMEEQTRQLTTAMEQVSALIKILGEK